MKRKTLLAIVDDWEAQERYEERLSADFEVHCAPFGSVGIQMARELDPHCILVDLVFEDMHSLEAVEALNKIPFAGKILLVSDEELDLAAFRNVVLLRRPFEFKKIIELLLS